VLYLQVWSLYHSLPLSPNVSSVCMCLSTAEMTGYNESILHDIESAIQYSNDNYRAVNQMGVYYLSCKQYTKVYKSYLPLPRHLWNKIHMSSCTTPIHVQETSPFKPYSCRHATIPCLCTDTVKLCNPCIKH